jgi:hypothetical protein
MEQTNNNKRKINSDSESSQNTRRRAKTTAASIDSGLTTETTRRTPRMKTASASASRTKTASVRTKTTSPKTKKALPKKKTDSPRMKTASATASAHTGLLPAPPPTASAHTGFTNTWLLPAPPTKDVLPTASAATASAHGPIEPFILNQGGKSFRLLVSIPVNNPNLWPTPNICYFRTTGTSNPGYSIFTGSWFPIVGIKETSTMKGYLTEHPDGFLIKMLFIMNKKDDNSDAQKQPKWICDLVGDYPIILEESEKMLFENKPSITIDEFIKKDKNIEVGKIDTRYERLANVIGDILKWKYEKFLNYFLYEWQAMLSLRIGGGYWDLPENAVFKEYVSTKLEPFDLVPVPHIHLKEANEEELEKKYFEHDNKRQPNRGKETIQFAKDTGTQLSMDQINAIKIAEQQKLKDARRPSVMTFDIYTIMQEKYTNPINNYKRRLENSRKPLPEALASTSDPLAKILAAAARFRQ